ncbi:hypothetical protein VCR14J2_30145 [Vibrio coralliirubri]|nr:hypothetical protein VCR14J2_30145 [Vibrio coralliirubri]
MKTLQQLGNIYHEIMAPKLPVIPELRNEVSGISNSQQKIPDYAPSSLSGMT